jgi:hypothetical protein
MGFKNFSSFLACFIQIPERAQEIYLVEHPGKRNASRPSVQRKSIFIEQNKNQLINGATHGRAIDTVEGRGGAARRDKKRKAASA